MQNIYWTLPKSALQFRLSYCTNSFDTFPLTGTQITSKCPRSRGEPHSFSSAAWSYFSPPFISQGAAWPLLAWAEALGITLGLSVCRVLHPICPRTVNFSSKISLHLFTFVLSLQPPPSLSSPITPFYSLDSILPGLSAFSHFPLQPTECWVFLLKYKSDCIALPLGLTYGFTWCLIRSKCFIFNELLQNLNSASDVSHVHFAHLMDAHTCQVHSLAWGFCSSPQGMPCSSFSSPPMWPLTE